MMSEGEHGKCVPSAFVRTLCELAAVELPCLELDGDDMSEGLVEELDRYADSGCHFEGASKRLASTRYAGECEGWSFDRE